MKELQVTIESQYQLKGTLTIPEGATDNFPAILIVQGTGQGDRDGNVKGMEMNLYKQLADYLTSIGFMTLRYDKRGTHESGGNYYESGVWDFIHDGVECVKFLKQQPKVDPERIIILGHSEGALLAPAIQEKESVAGIILLAGCAQPSKDMMPKQRDMALKEMAEAKGFKGWLFRTLKVVEKAKKQNAAIDKKILESDEAVMKIKGMKFNAKWYRETLQFNVVEHLANVEVPVLAITGDNDVQVPPEDVKLIDELVKGEAEWHIIPKMNHLLRKYEAKHSMLGIMKEYKSLVGTPTDPELLSILDTWLKKHFNK